MDSPRAKNYLVILLGKVKHGPAHSPDLEDKYPLYQKMAKLAESSARKHLKNLDEIKYIGGTFENTDELFKFWFLETRRLWNSEKCNVLTSSCDTLFIQECDVFDVYKDFSLFGVNSPSSYWLDGLCSECGSIALDSPRYFPHTMEKEVMEYGKNLFAEGELTSKGQWGGEMAVNNKMFYKQRNGFYRNEKNLMEHLSKRPHQHVMAEGAWDWTLQARPELQWPIEAIGILAFSATRGQEQTLEQMVKCNKHFNQ